MEGEEEEMLYIYDLGLIGIFAESCKLIFKWRKIFTKITLTLILPLSFIILAHEGIPMFVIKNTEFTNLSNLSSSQWGVSILLNAVYFTLLVVFSLLPASTVIYTVACAHTSTEIRFKLVMSVVPRVCRRLMLTFLCTFLGFMAYIILLALIVLLWLKFIGNTRAGPMILVIVFVLYPLGFIYMTIIWQLSSVVTVLEDSCGLEAMNKSKNLIKGKLMVSVVIFFMFSFSLAFVNNYFRANVVYSWGKLGILQIIGKGSLCLFVLVNLNLFALVVQTVFYFVCKTYHHENIDKSALSTHLEVYGGDYVPLKIKDVQLEHYDDV